MILYIIGLVYYSDRHRQLFLDQWYTVLAFNTLLWVTFFNIIDEAWSGQHARHLVWLASIDIWTP